MPYPPQGLIATGGEAAGDWEVIAEVEPTSDVDYVEFTGLDINSDKAYVIFMTYKNPLSVAINNKMYVNDDLTDADYYSQRISANGTSVGASQDNAPYIGGANASSSSTMVIFVMLDPNGYMRASVIQNVLTGTDLYVILRVVVSNNTFANITKIRIQASESGGIGAGSKFVLARVKRP